MGSSPSKDDMNAGNIPLKSTDTTSSEESSLPASSSSSTTTTTNKNNNANNQLSGMQLVQRQCRKKKRIYDKCVTQWYTNEFMTGKSLSQEETCGDVFETYKSCVLRGVKREVWDKGGMPPPKEGSLLAELDDEEEEK
jgi:hypothetical protein